MPNNEKLILANEKPIIIDKSIYELLQEVRYEMTKIPIRKSGVNKHLNYNYFETADFLPTAHKLFYERGLCPLFSIGYDPNTGIEMAYLRIIKGAEALTVQFPTDTPTNMSGIQAVGAKITYMERYCYRSLLGLTENDIVDLTLDDTSRNVKVEDKTATPKQIEKIRQLYDEENIAKMIEYYGVSNLEELKMTQASEAIARKKK